MALADFGTIFYLIHLELPVIDDGGQTFNSDILNRIIIILNVKEDCMRVCDIL